MNTTISEIVPRIRTIDHLAEVIYQVDRSGKVLYLNKYGCNLLEIDETQLTNLHIHDINPDLIGNRWKNVSSIAQETGHWKIISHLKLKTGEQLPIEISFNFSNDNSEQHFFCIAHLINDLKQPEKFLNIIATATATDSGQEFFESLMESMAKVINVKHAFITECLDQPPTRVKMLAFWSANKIADNMEYDLVGTPCDSVISNKKNVFIDDKLGEIYPKEKGFAESYFGVPIYDKEHLNVIGHMAFLDDKLMSDEGLEHTVFDILASRASVELQRMHIEQALIECEKKYRLLVDNQNDLIVHLNDKAEILYVSPSSCETLGKSEAELFGKSILEFIHKDEVSSAIKVWKQVQYPSVKKIIELRTLTAQGLSWFSWSFSKIPTTNDKDEFIAVGRDISARVRADELAQKTSLQLAHINRLSSMGEMATGIAHELNQPLTAILSFAQASKRILEQKNFDIEEQKEILDRIAKNAKLSGDIIQRIRSYVKKEEIEVTPIDLNLLVANVSSLLSTELRHNNINLNYHADESIPRILGDSTQMQQVLINIIRNSIDIINDHSMQTREIIISTNSDTKEHINIKIEDSGPGIEPKLIDTLFESFVSTKPNGMGIGLSICKTIIESFSGKISATNSEQGGALFLLTLPVIKKKK